MSPERSFVGRQRELALLWSNFETAAGGQAGVVLVTGEAGIGKTCLLHEAAAHAAVVNAIYNATGVRIRHLPALPEKVPAGCRSRPSSPGIR
jgi:Cdc6-like AAA superfamily ATPase